MDVTVRITQTYHILVTADFGDTPEALIERGIAELGKDDKATPDAVTAVLLPKEAVL